MQYGVYWWAGDQHTHPARGWYVIKEQSAEDWCGPYRWHWWASVAAVARGLVTRDVTR